MVEPSAAAPPNHSGQSTDVEEQVLYEGRSALLPNLGALLVAVFTIGIGLLYYASRRMGCHYRITSQRVVIERGVLSKRLEQIDLYRITDYVVDRPFSQRLMGTGNLLIKSSDPTTPEVRLEGLNADVVALYERLRAATEVQKRVHGVRVVDHE